jgi:hypothetical protein
VRVFIGKNWGVDDSLLLVSLVRISHLGIMKAIADKL